MTYTSADFDKERLADYTLLAQVGQGENALAIVDNEQQLRFVTTYDPAAIEQQVNDILGLDFRQVKIVVRDHGYSFIPAEVFDEAQLPVYRRYLPDDQLTEPLVSDIASLGIKLICQINKLGSTPLSDRFPHATVHAAIAVLLHSVASYGTRASGHTVVIHRMASSVGIYFFDSGKFWYGNDFEVYGADDLNYYLLAMLAHLGLEGKQLNVLLSGDIAADDEYHRRIMKYSDRLTFADMKQLTGIAIPMELQPHQHRFLTLFGLNQCE